MKLTVRFGYENEKARNALEILTLAKKGLDLDLGYRSVELIVAGNQNEKAKDKAKKKQMIKL